MVQSAQEVSGRTSGDSVAHDIYSSLRDREGHLCCNGQDCMPVEALALPDGNYYLPKSDEIIPADMATPSPDDRFHHCTYYPVAKDVEGIVPATVELGKEALPTLS